MAISGTLAGLWRRYRALAGWAQVSLALAAVVVLASPFSSEAEETGGGASTTIRSVPATVAVPTTAAVATTTTTPAPAPSTTTTRLPTGVPAAGDDSSVERVIDGDTIVAAGGTRVRLIGVDTPETGDCYSSDATRYLNELLPAGTRIRLVYDVERLDRYGRTLAYVYKLGDGVFVNLAVARNGFASQLTVPPNVAHAEAFRVAVSQARVAELGLWRACQPATTVPVVTAAPTTQATVARAVTTTTAAPVGGGGCHASYSGACVPTGFSDVDCAGGSGNGPGYVSTKNFRVVGPDEYDLDADGDGIGCESR
jgi:micrococcal nuclease